MSYADTFRFPSDNTSSFSIPDCYIRRIFGSPKSGLHAINNARQGAIWLEQNRADMAADALRAPEVSHD